MWNIFLLFFIFLKVFYNGFIAGLQGAGSQVKKVKTG
jgi:hypothetical protein